VWAYLPTDKIPLLLVKMVEKTFERAFFFFIEKLQNCFIKILYIMFMDETVVIPDTRDPQPDQHDPGCPASSL